MNGLVVGVVRNPWFWTLVGVAVIAYWFFFYLDWVTIAADRNLSSEARSDPYYGAKRFLAELNVESRSELPSDEPFFRILAPRDSVVLLSGPSEELNPEHKIELTNWIFAGGRVIYVARTNSATTKQLLDRFGLSMHATRERHTVPKSLEKCSRAGSLELRRFDAAGNEYFALAHPNWVIQRNDGEGSASPISHEQRGKGAFVFVTSAYQWHNGPIECHDTAVQLYTLVNGQSRSPFTPLTLYWLNPRDDQTLLAMLWDKYTVAVLLLVVLVLLWIWNRNLRESPVSQDHRHESIASSVTNMLLSIGLFKYQNGGTGELLLSLRQEILARHEGLSRTELLKRFQQSSTESSSDIQDALFGSGFRSDMNFVQKVAILQQLRQVGREE